MADHPPASSVHSHSSDHNPGGLTEEGVKSPNTMERAKGGFEGAFRHNKSPHHHKETHGTSDDIDETTPPEAVKGPNVFQCVKEEVEAIIEAIHPKKDSKDPK